MDMVAVAVTAGVAAVVIRHTDGAKAERWAGVDEAAPLAFGSRAAVKASGPLPVIAEQACCLDAAPLLLAAT